MNDEFDPLTGDPLPKTNKAVKTADSQTTAQSATNPALSEAELANIESLPVSRLIAIIRACNPHSVKLLAMTDEQQAQFILDTQLITAGTAEEKKDAHASAKWWFDRKIGPVVQKSAALIGVTDGREFMRQVIDSLKDDDVLVQNTKY